MWHIYLICTTTNYPWYNSQHRYNENRSSPGFWWIVPTSAFAQKRRDIVVYIAFSAYFVPIDVCFFIQKCRYVSLYEQSKRFVRYEISCVNLGKWKNIDFSSPLSATFTFLSGETRHMSLFFFDERRGKKERKRGGNTIERNTKEKPTMVFSRASTRHEMSIALVVWILSSNFLLRCNWTEKQKEERTWCSESAVRGRDNVMFWRFDSCSKKLVVAERVYRFTHGSVATKFSFNPLFGYTRKAVLRNISRFRYLFLLVYSWQKSTLISLL